MTAEEFRKRAHETVDWVADYLEQIEKYPVKSPVKPKEIYNQIPDSAPETAEDYDRLIQDLNEKILPGMTHWQHPNFHAYFPGNSSYPSILAEIITAGLGAQCMIWETSPAAAELEERMMEWLKALMHLPENWSGVIQDTASTATLAAILSAREQITAGSTNRTGFSDWKLRIYCSSEAHSSIDKAVKIAGIGVENLVRIKTDNDLSIIPSELKKAIEADLKAGLTPCCVISCLGTTSTLAFDPSKAIGEICSKYQVWHHIDAAYAGSALVLPELDWMRSGLDTADSFVFNPHKWLFVNFDCSAYFVRDKEALIRTFEILPEYLKTKTHGQVNDYRDWGIQLGRRFRALKLWFVLRTYGAQGVRDTIRKHVEFGKWIGDRIEEHQHFELLTPQRLNMVVFRYVRKDLDDATLDTLNAELLNRINTSGHAYLTHTRVHGKYGIRLVAGQTRVEQRHLEKVWQLVLEYAEKS